MTVMVDVLMQHGWMLRGKNTLSCHMICDGDLNELHEVAARMGLKRDWFQPTSVPHYDLTPAKRDEAVRLGVKEIDRRELVYWVRLWRWWDAGCRRG